MRPRLHVLALLVTLPLWVLPGLLWVGWDKAGRELFKDLPDAVRWVLFGKKPY